MHHSATEILVAGSVIGSLITSVGWILFYNPSPSKNSQPINAGRELAKMRGKRPQSVIDKANEMRAKQGKPPYVRGGE